MLHLDTLFRAALEEKGWLASSSATGQTTFLFFLNIYFWLHWVFVAVRAFSSCGERGYSLLAVCELLIAVASSLGQSTGSRAHGLQ